MQDQDISATLQQACNDAIKNQLPVQLRGGSSKAFYGREARGYPLSVAEHRGVINYQPSELVLTARCGTPLQEIEQTLAAEGQMLPFEPPNFASTATLGGTVACGFSGPRRAFTGSVRDFVLGCKMINGRGEVLEFGGEVMKNVAGYDVSRLLAGSMGTLGIILQVSLKVLPRPRHEQTWCLATDENRVIDRLTELAGKNLPFSGIAYHDGLIYIRLAGAELAVHEAAATLTAEAFADGDRFWHDLREHRLGFFRQEGELWRITVPPACKTLALNGDWLYDWAGALRWLISAEPAESVFSVAEQAGGHAVLFRGKDRNGDVFQPLPEKLRQLNLAVKQAFDPEGIFNPFRINRHW